MKNLSDLKRTIQPGMKLRVIHHDYRPELIGTTRIVTKTQTNGYWFKTCSEEGAMDKTASWSQYTRAGCYSFPTPTSYTQDDGMQPNGKRARWTIEIL